VVLMREVCQLYKLGIIRFGEFTLSSGKRSTFYINLRELPSYPELFRYIMKKLLDKVDVEPYDAICGIAVGGIPFAAYIAFKYGKPLVYVRKKRKEYGAGDLIVGNVSGKNILLIDDVATTGGSLIYATNVLRKNGAIVNRVALIVLRNKKVIDVLREHGVVLQYLYYAGDIIEVLYREGLIDRKNYERALEELK